MSIVDSDHSDDSGDFDESDDIDEFDEFTDFDDFYDFLNKEVATIVTGLQVFCPHLLSYTLPLICLLLEIVKEHAEAKSWHKTSYKL